MDITTAALEEMFKGFNTLFNKVHDATPSHWRKVAMDVKSTGSEEVYGWLTGLPQMREWIGERYIGEAAKKAYAIKNRKFETTIRVQRTDIEDDRLGIYSPQVQMIAHEAASHPDQLIFELMREAFEKPCFDGQPFFDADHPVLDQHGAEQSVSNFAYGAAPAWYLLDTSKALKPFVFQTRIPYKMQSLTDDKNDHVFSRDEYLYGVRARVNAGFGLWQLAFGSKQVLTAENYQAARTSLQKMRYDYGRIMGVMPNLMVVGPENEAAARAILKAEQIEGSDNIWAGSCDLLVTPFLAE